MRPTWSLTFLQFTVLKGVASVSASGGQAVAFDQREQLTLAIANEIMYENA